MQYIYQSSPPAFAWSSCCTICHIRGEDICIFPSLPTRTHPCEDGGWYVQAACNCHPRQHPKCSQQKCAFFQGLLFCLTCKMETLLVGAVHILNNPVQWSLSAQQRADGGMPALPALVQLDTGQISCRNPATPLAASPSACTSLKQGFLSWAYDVGLLLHQCSCRASRHALARAPAAWGTPLLPAMVWRSGCVELLWAAQDKKPTFWGSYCIW